MRYSNLGGRAAILAGAVAMALTGCGQRPAPPKPPPPTVKTWTAALGSVTPAQTLPGIIAPYQNVAIQSTLTETADSVLIQEGDHVHRGQVLAQLNTSDLQANLQANLSTASSFAATAAHTQYAGALAITQGVNGVTAAATTLAQSQKTLATDSANLQRDQQLYAQGYVAQTVLQQQQTLVANDQEKVRSDQANLDSARSLVQANGTLSKPGLQTTSIQQSRASEETALSQAQQIRVQIAKATLTSPVDGVVVNRTLNPGEYPGTRQLFTIQQTDPIYAVVRGSGAQIANMQVGSTAYVAISDLGDRAFRGTVAAILNQVNPGSTDFMVKVVLSNPSGRIRPGMAVAAHVAMPPLRGVRIPVTAFTDDTHGSVMIVRNGTVATAHVLETGGDGTYSVVRGLAPGAHVVMDGQLGFANGQQVAAQ